MPEIKITLSEEVAETIRGLAAREEINITELFRRALSQYVMVNKLFDEGYELTKELNPEFEHDNN